MMYQCANEGKTRYLTYLPSYVKHGMQQLIFQEIFIDKGLIYHEKKTRYLMKYKVQKVQVGLNVGARRSCKKIVDFGERNDQNGFI